MREREIWNRPSRAHCDVATWARKRYARAMNTSVLPNAVILFASLLTLAACSMRDQPAIGASGEEIYRVSACASCHGENLEGLGIAPPLLGLSALWSRDELGAFLGDPDRFLEQVERLQQLDFDYSSSMPKYSNLSLDERDRLAGFLLSK